MQQQIQTTEVNHTFLLPQLDTSKDEISQRVDSVIAPIEHKLETGLEASLPEENQIELRHWERLLRLHPRANKLNVLRKRVQRVLTTVRSLETKEIQVVEFEDLISGLSPEQIRIIGKTLVTVQLTTGCSNGCSKCAFNAPSQIRRRLSWNAIKKNYKIIWSRFHKK